MANLTTYLVAVFILLIYEELTTNAHIDADNCEPCYKKWSKRQCFSKSEWCNGVNECNDGKDEHHCNLVSPNCKYNQKSCDSGQCIPIKWMCDGYKDCSDGSDENCINGDVRLKDLPNVHETAENSINWLLNQRNRDWSWGQDTARVAVALHLSDAFQFSSTNITSKLISKELVLQLAIALFRNKSVPITIDHLALFVHGLLATCQETRHFYGYNVISYLHNLTTESEFINPIALLVLCNAGYAITDENVDKLKNLTAKSTDPVSLDTKTIATMALICINRTRNDSTLDEIISNYVHAFKSLQKSDGSFGNFYTTNLVIQVFLGVNDFQRWNITEAFHYIIKQYETRKFDNILANYLLAPVLKGHSLLNLDQVKCPQHTNKNRRNITLSQRMEEHFGEKIHVQYSLWVGDRQQIERTCVLLVPAKTSFYDVMRLASELDSKYTFQWSNLFGKKYIFSISSIANDPELRMYWKLFKATSNSLPQPLYKGAEEIYPENQEHYIYWYKKLRSSSSSKIYELSS